MQDDVEMKIIQEELFENFQQRIQTRRALIELDEQNASNILEMKKKKAEILDWERNDVISSKGFENAKRNEHEVEDRIKRPLSALPKEV